MTCILLILKIMSASRLAVVRYFKKRLQSVLRAIVERFVACLRVQKEKGGKTGKGRYSSLFLLLALITVDA